ncbi:MAG: YceI family protein [Candidatus Eremiobacteraeota bacterium]|nr:YceI family protein [Candidatus Eremiobacteraeota bacterium]
MVVDDKPMKTALRRSALTLALLAAATLPTIAAQRPSVRAIDAQHSKMTIYVDKQGLFSALADNHVIDAPITAGRYDPLSRSVELTIESARIQVLDQHYRDNVQKTMDAQVLEVSKYPTITFRSTSIDERDPKRWIVNGNLTLHGTTRAITLQVVPADASHFNGSTTIRQTEFGITPIKVMGGAVSVKDDVKVDFDIVLSP